MSIAIINIISHGKCFQGCFDVSEYYEGSTTIEKLQVTGFI